MKYLDLITRIKKRLNDEGTTFYDPDEILADLSAAEREIATFKPEAATVTGSINLVAGSRQTLPATAIGGLSLIRNLGVDGSVAGAAIRKVTLDTLSSLFPEWPSLPVSASVRFFVPDPDNERKYLVVPAQPATPHKVEGTYVQRPATPADSNADIVLDETYAPAMEDYAMAGAYSGDNEEGDYQRAVSYYNKFLNRLGLKLIDSHPGGSIKTRFGGQVKEA